jgi:hypothetical protein
VIPIIRAASLTQAFLDGGVVSQSRWCNDAEAIHHTMMQRRRPSRWAGATMPNAFVQRRPSPGDGADRVAMSLFRSALIAGSPVVIAPAAMQPPHALASRHAGPWALFKKHRRRNTAPPRAHPNPSPHLAAGAP